MLTHLTIENLVLIEKLSLDFAKGLTVLTGETGAGKSILLDSLGLIFGRRSEQGLVRRGQEKSIICAHLSILNNSDIQKILDDSGIDHDGETLILRRILFADGKSKAFINDMPTTIGLLKQIGDVFLEIHGQFDTHGLLDPKNHRFLLDDFAAQNVSFKNELLAVRQAYETWRQASRDYNKLKEQAEKQDQNSDYLRFALEEFESLNPQTGEEETLAAARSLRLNQEKIIQALQTAMENIAGENGAESTLKKSLSAIDNIGEKAGGKLEKLLSSLNSAVAETENVIYEIQAIENDLQIENDADFQEMEDRLFALRDLARKHRLTVDDLPELYKKMKQDLMDLDSIDDLLSRAMENAKHSETAFIQAAQKLTIKRKQAAENLATAVAAELPAMKMERASFTVSVDKLPLEKGNEYGLDNVSFLVATNTGSVAAPLAKIASGGELARFMLAIKVALRAVQKTPLLIFDEVDTGVGGAVADAIGDRLRLLADSAQIFLVTHSPQVAAKGHHHWLVSKKEENGDTQSSVFVLNQEKRREELARMLAGSTITDEARAAADRLLDLGSKSNHQDQKKIA